MEAPADRLVDASEAGLVVARDDEFERGPVLEEILAHEARGDGIAASELLNPAFRPASSFLRFGRGDEPCAAETGEIGRMAIGVACGEGLDRSGLMVVAEQPGNCR